MNRALPLAIRLRRSLRIRLCHEGDLMGLAEPVRSVHSDSMAASFSWRVIVFRGRVFAMSLVYNLASWNQIYQLSRTPET